MTLFPSCPSFTEQPFILPVRYTEYTALRPSCSLISDNIRCLTLLDTLELLTSPSCENATPAVKLVIRNLRLPNLRHRLLSAGDPWRRTSHWSNCPPKPTDMRAFMASLPGLRFLAVPELSESAMELVPRDAVPELSIFNAEQPASSLYSSRPTSPSLRVERR